MRTSRHFVLLAGPSGSGKSRLAASVDAVALSLDDFYKDGGTPGLPRTLGITDWDDIATWNQGQALQALLLLAKTGQAEIPIYDISQNRRVGTRHVTVPPRAVVIAEGLFAIDLLTAAVANGLIVHPLWLDRPTAMTFTFRLARDLRERRKSPPIVVKRGLALARAEAKLKARALAAGFRPLSYAQALDYVTHLPRRGAL